MTKQKRWRGGGGVREKEGEVRGGGYKHNKSMGLSVCQCVGVSVCVHPLFAVASFLFTSINYHCL